MCGRIYANSAAHFPLCNRFVGDNRARIQLKAMMPCCSGSREDRSSCCVTILYFYRVKSRPIYGIFRSDADTARHAANTHVHSNMFSKVIATEFIFPVNWNRGNDCNLFSKINPMR